MRIPRGSTALKWIFCFLTAVCVAAVTIVMEKVISFAYTARQILIAEVSEKHTLSGIFVMYAGFNVTCAIMGAFCILLGSPQASGSGLTELVSFLNGIAVPKFLTFRTFIFKVLGSVVTVASSLPTGYQGVLLHIGGMIAFQLSEYFPRFELTAGAKRFASERDAETHCMATVDTTSEHGIYTSEARLPISAPHRLLKIRSSIDTPLSSAAITPSPPGGTGNTELKGEQVHFLASTTVTDLVACGAAAGMAAAFKAPIGGMLYVMELSTRWRLELTWRTFFSTSVTTLGLTLLTDGCRENAYCSFIAPRGGGKSWKDYSAYKFMTPLSELHYIVILGVAMGLLGSLYVSLNCRLCKMRKRWSHSKGWLLLEVTCLSLVHSFAFLLMASLGKCRSCEGSLTPVCLSSGNRPDHLARLFCTHTEYNDLGTLVVSSAGSSIRNLWTSGFDSYDARSLGIFIPVYFLIFAWTNGVCMPTGSFTPTILLGSACGRMFCHILHVTGAVKDPDARFYALLGAAGFFTGQTRMTIGLCVVLLEMTQVESILPFLMLVVIVAKGTADRWNDSLIIRKIYLKQLPFLTRMPHLDFRRHKVSAINVAVKTAHPTLPRVASLSLIQQTLVANAHARIFVVLAQDMHQVTRSSLGSLQSVLPMHSSLHSSDINAELSGQIFLGVLSRNTLEACMTRWIAGSPSFVDPLVAQLAAPPIDIDELCLVTPPDWFEETSATTSHKQTAPPSMQTPLLNVVPHRNDAPTVTKKPLLYRGGSIAGNISSAAKVNSHNDAGRDWAATTDQLDGTPPHKSLFKLSDHALPLPYDDDSWKCASEDGRDCKDLTLLMQAPPVSITPSMDLSAIFYLMNTMSLELMPVLSPGSVYHGLVTRASIIRYQKRHQYYL